MTFFRFPVKKTRIRDGGGGNNGWSQAGPQLAPSSTIQPLQQYSHVNLDDGWRTGEEERGGGRKKGAGNFMA